MDDKLAPILRQGLVQYIGALMQNSNLEGKAAAQVVAAALSEEALKIAKTETEYDFYVAKPILRASIVLLKERIKELRLLGETTEDIKPILDTQIQTYENAITALDKLINSAKEKAV